MSITGREYQEGLKGRDGLSPSLSSFSRSIPPGHSNLHSMIRSILLSFLLVVSSRGLLLPSSYQPNIPSSYQPNLQSSLYLRDLLPTRFNSLAPQSIIRPASQAELSPYSYQSSLMYGKTPAVPYPSVYSMPWLAPQPLTQDDLHFLMLMTSLPMQRPSPYPYYLPYQKKRRL